MHKRLLLLSLVIGVIIGLAFVYWPKENSPYLGPVPDNGTCENLQPNGTPYPSPGVKKTGFPMTNQTVYKGGHCPVVNESIVSTTKAIEDFLIGGISGLALVIIFQKVKNRR